MAPCGSSSADEHVGWPELGDPPRWGPSWATGSIASGDTRPSNDGPSRAPATTSPMTGGWPWANALPRRRPAMTAESAAGREKACRWLCRRQRPAGAGAVRFRRRSNQEERCDRGRQHAGVGGDDEQAGRRVGVNMIDATAPVGHTCVPLRHTGCLLLSLPSAFLRHLGPQLVHQRPQDVHLSSNTSLMASVTVLQVRVFSHVGG